MVALTDEEEAWVGADSDRRIVATYLRTALEARPEDRMRACHDYITSNRIDRMAISTITTLIVRAGEACILLGLEEAVVPLVKLLCQSTVFPTTGERSIIRSAFEHRGVEFAIMAHKEGIDITLDDTSRHDLSARTKFGAAPRVINLERALDMLGYCVRNNLRETQHVIIQSFGRSVLEPYLLSGRAGKDLMAGIQLYDPVLRSISIAIADGNDECIDCIHLNFFVEHYILDRTNSQHDLFHMSAMVCLGWRFGDISSFFLRDNPAPRVRDAWFELAISLLPKRLLKGFWHRVNQSGRRYSWDLCLQRRFLLSGERGMAECLRRRETEIRSELNLAFVTEERAEDQLVRVMRTASLASKRNREHIFNLLSTLHPCHHAHVYAMAGIPWASSVFRAITGVEPPPDSVLAAHNPEYARRIALMSVSRCTVGGETDLDSIKIAAERAARIPGISLVDALRFPSDINQYGGNSCIILPRAFMRSHAALLRTLSEGTFEDYHRSLRLKYSIREKIAALYLVAGTATERASARLEELRSAVGKGVELRYSPVGDLEMAYAVLARLPREVVELVLSYITGGREFTSSPGRQVLWARYHFHLLERALEE